MKTVLGIPSGNRVYKLLKVIEKWRNACDFEIATATWDVKTVKAVNDVFLYATNEMGSFACNHNMLASIVPDWDIYICGADDLYPANAISKIAPVCEQNPEKVIWVRDGLYDALPTHPIITRGWYDKYGCIFDEDYRHNFTDTDLFVRCLKAGEIVKCFDIAFDHRHPLKTGEPADDIYQVGAESFQADRARFYARHPDADRVITEMISEVKEVRL